jgi:hypothetical protein
VRYYYASSHIHRRLVAALVMMSPLPRATSPVASPLPQTQHCPTLESPTPTLENCAYASLFLLPATKLCIDVRQVSISVESEPVNTRPTRAFLIMTETLTIVGYDQELPADHPVDGVHTFPMSMTAAAFLGIAWYLCAELNVRLLLKATRRSLYFWACLLCSWGIIIHCLVIVLDNFKVWKTIGSLVIIELSWCTFVVAQSVVLYSRLSLVLNNDRILGHVFRMIVVNAVVFGLGTVVLGLVIVSVNNDLWEVQSLTGAATPGSQYDFEVGQSQPHMGHDPIRCFLCPRSPHRSLVLKNMTLLGTDKAVTRRNMRQLIAVNVFIIALDCSLMGLCYSQYFFLQGFYKAAIYAVKLQTEFTILNQLRSSLPGGTHSYSGHMASANKLQGKPKPDVSPKSRASDGSEVEMIGMERAVVRPNKEEIC